MSLFNPEAGEEVTAYLQDRLNGMVTGLIIAVEYIDDEGAERHFIAGAPNQTMTRTSGLIDFLNAYSAYETGRYIEESFDDE